MRRLLIFLCLIFAGCAPPAARVPKPRQSPPLDQTDPSGVYTVGNKPLLWPLARLPVTFSFATGTPAGIKTACRNAGATFNEAAGRALFRFADEDIAVPKDQDASFGHNVITYGRRPPVRKSEAGLAHTIYIGNRIVEVHVDLNPINLPEGGGWWWDASAESVCLHELGHAIGLNHRDSPTSIMFPYEVLHLKRLSADDTARVRQYYGPSAR